MKPALYITLFIFAATFSACTENEVIPDETTIDSPVVEGYLEPGNEISVYLSKMILFALENADSVQQPITGKDVYIQHNGTDYLLEPSTETPGYYTRADSGLMIPGDEYRLHFEYNDQTVSATTTIPFKPAGTGLTPAVLQVNPNQHPGMTQNKVTVYWDNPDNSYHLIITEYLDSLYQPINPYLDPEVFDDFRKVSTRPTLDNTYNLDTRRQLLFFGHYRVIIYKINEEYVNLYENISQSSLNPTEPLTNVENGLGIFTGINSDTLFLEVQKIWW